MNARRVPWLGLGQQGVPVGIPLPMAVLRRLITLGSLQAVSFRYRPGPNSGETPSYGSSSSDHNP